MKTTEIKQQVVSGKYDALIEDLYADPSLLDYQKQRYAAALDKYQTLFGDDEVSIYSAAGRSEISGNHTDHQHGCVLAGSINLDAIGIVSKQDHVIKVISDDFDIKPIDLNDLDKKENEIGTSEALIRGVVSKLKELGYNVGGFKAFITSDVLMGAGLSSSAAFESIIGTIIDGLYNDMKIDMVTIAKVGQYAENVYFGKPCGLMDQCACAVGGLISIDFKDTSNPIVNSVNVDFSKYDHSLCIVDTKGSHADLTDAYGAVPQEMKEVAHYFGKEVLREVDEDEFYANIANLRTALNNDRAIWIRLMQNTWGRAAVATVAAVLALTMWRTGTLEQILHTGQQLNTWLPQTTQQTEPELLGKPVNDKAPQQSTAPLGKPIEDKKQLTEKLSDALDALLHRSADTTEK